MDDTPIDPQNFLAGVKVVDIGDVRVSRGMARRHHSACPHQHLVYDRHERRVHCSDCERDVDAFDAFEQLVQQFHTAHESLKERARAVAEAERFTLISRAAKAVDRFWRGRTMVPKCPHCREGLLPEDLLNPGAVSAELARANRRRKERGMDREK